MAFGIEILGLDKLVSGFNAAPAVLAAQTRTAMETGGLLIEGHAKSNVRKRTGRLAGSITHRISGGGANLSCEIGPSVQYGLYPEYGTRPHWMPPGILPFPAMLSISKKGTKAYPFMKPAFDANVSRITTLFRDIGFKVVQRMAS